MFSLPRLLHRRRPSQPSRNAVRLFVERLEDRTVPSAVSSITGNVNGTAMPGGATVWFNSVLKVSGLGAAPATLHVVDGAIDFTAGGTPYHLTVPNATIVFTPGALLASTLFDTTANRWDTNVSSVNSGNVWMTGAALPIPNGLPGGIKGVTWTASFYSDTVGLSVNWQWAAAVYKSFSTSYNTLFVKPVDSNVRSVYRNSDHAGTPEAFKAEVTGGATGGGGSNLTGSYSATKSVNPRVGEATSSEPATLSGMVTDAASGAALGGIILTLTGTDDSGNAFTLTTTTVGGTYSFANLAPGANYTVTMTIPASYEFATSAVGTVGGTSDGTATSDGTQIGQINRNAGDTGLNYNFSLGNPIAS